MYGGVFMISGTGSLARKHADFGYDSDGDLSKFLYVILNLLLITLLNLKL